MTSHVAFLRGINVGGHRTVKMSDIRTAFEQAGFQNVRTLLASGNVLFESGRSDEHSLTREIEGLLKDTFGFEIEAILRTSHQISALVESDPFAVVGPQGDLKLYASFAADRPANEIELPYRSPTGDFRILKICDRDILSVVAPGAGRSTSDAMKFIEREFGPKITTRNWNTVLKTHEKS